MPIALQDNCQMMSTFRIVNGKISAQNSTGSNLMSLGVKMHWH